MATILIVDDEVGIVDLLADVLESQGFQVETATNGNDGLAAYSALRPDAVLLDVAMPQMDGLATLSEIRKVDPEARVAMLTGICTKDTVTSAIHAGAKDFIPKPFDTERLVAAVEDLLVPEPR